MSPRMPIRTKVLAALVLAPLMGAATAGTVLSQGTWEATLQPRDFNNDGIADAYFDTDLGVTWLREAYMAQAYGFPPGRPVVFWSDAVETVTHLDVDGVTGWRLPQVTNLPNATGSSQSHCAWDADPRLCGDNPDPSLSELAHLYYVTLGNQNQANGGLTNTGPFDDVTWEYWSGTKYQDGVWEFGMAAASGSQWLGDPVGAPAQAWAVHDGDVGIPMVPEPPAGALFAAGIAAVGVALRKRPGRNG